MAATFVTVGGTNYPLPSNSSNLWHGRDVIETRKPSAKLFHALLEETGETDDAGRPILELSKRIAVNYALLEQNEAPRGEHNPVVSAYKKVVDAEPHKYIRLSELADENCGRAKGLYTLFGQWALFHQPEGSLGQPQLFAMMTRPQLQIYLPGAIISSMSGLDKLLSRYSLVQESDFLGSLGLQMTGHFILAGQETSDDRRIHHADAKPIHPTKRVFVRPLEASKLGLNGDGIVIRDDAGEDIVLSGHVYRSVGKIQLAQFGLVEAPVEKGHITFLEHRLQGHSHTLLSPAKARMIQYDEDRNALSRQIIIISDALHHSGAWEKGVVPAAKRLVRWAGQKALRCVGLKYGD